MILALPRHVQHSMCWETGSGLLGEHSHNIQVGSPFYQRSGKYSKNNNYIQIFFIFCDFKLIQWHDCILRLFSVSRHGFWPWCTSEVDVALQEKVQKWTSFKLCTWTSFNLTDGKSINLLFAVKCICPCKGVSTQMKSVYLTDTRSEERRVR